MAGETALAPADLGISRTLASDFDRNPISRLGPEDSDAVGFSENAQNALRDRDWIAGYEAGLDDARRGAEGFVRLEPGVTRSSYDGWSAGPN
jgi:hypothetical protein